MGKQVFFTDAMWPPTMEQVKQYFSQKGMDDQEAEHFFQLYQFRQWRNRKGEMIKRWKNAAHGWIFFAMRTNSNNNHQHIN
ncbi:MAG: hypothetical protein ABI581_08190 [Sediminibacterium sp.]